MKYPYDACNDDELTLKEGDLITLISKDGQDRGWWRGELNGQIGVFPDNFVTLIPINELNGPPIAKEKRSEKVSPNKIAPQVINESGKPSSVAAQRKSLELKYVNNTPPVPGKKPNVPKKSPQAVKNMATPKFVDKVDGAANSRAAKSGDKDNDNEFDKIERSSMLLDMRANRAKAPGRRPPSTVYKDNELVNGNTEHVTSTQDLKTDTSNDEEETEKKPLVREWEKNKAPWVAELKQNQAKRTSTSPQTHDVQLRHKVNEKSSPDRQDTSFKMKSIHVNEKSTDNEITDPKAKSPIKHIIESSPEIKSTPSSNTPSKTSEVEQIVLRSRTPTQPIAITPARPQSIHSNSSPSDKSPLSQSLSPNVRSQVTEKTVGEVKVTNVDFMKSSENKTTQSILTSRGLDKKVEYVSLKQYTELVDRIAHMETKMNNKLLEMQAKIDELECKLQVESDLRRLFQAELEKVAQCVTQV